MNILSITKQPSSFVNDINISLSKNEDLKITYIYPEMDKFHVPKDKLEKMGILLKPIKIKSSLSTPLYTLTILSLGQPLSIKCLVQSSLIEINSSIK